MNDRINYLKAARFERPDFIPMVFAINPACWNEYDHQAIFDLMESHGILFPNYIRPKGNFTPNYSLIARKDKPFLDDFGCTWTTARDGLTGTVTGHPLAEWNAFKNWKAPDPDTCTGIGPVDWEHVAIDIARKRQTDGLVFGGLRHGHTFLQLSDLRGYQNLLYDFVDEEPCLINLIESVENFNMGIVRHYLDIGVDVMTYAEDLGMQNGPMLSPDQFKKYIKPSYQRLMNPAREHGVLVHMHSDGDLHDLIDDIIDGGVDIINLQDVVNGIDWIASRFAGKICVELDIDRQLTTVFGSPYDTEQLIANAVKTIGSKHGGLMMVFGWYPGAPLSNIKALMDAMEKYSFYYT